MLKVPCLNVNGSRDYYSEWMDTRTVNTYINYWLSKLIRKMIYFYHKVYLNSMLHLRGCEAIECSKICFERNSKCSRFECPHCNYDTWLRFRETIELITEETYVLFVKRYRLPLKWSRLPRRHLSQGKVQSQYRVTDKCIVFSGTRENVVNGF